MFKPLFILPVFALLAALLFAGCAEGPGIEYDYYISEKIENFDAIYNRTEYVFECTAYDTEAEQKTVYAVVTKEVFNRYNIGDPFDPYNMEVGR